MVLPKKNSSSTPIADDAADPSRYSCEVTNPPRFMGVAEDHTELVNSSTGEVHSLVKPPEKQAIKNARTQRYKLQHSAREILFDFFGSDVPKDKNGYAKLHRTCCCNRHLINGDHVDVVKSAKTGKSLYKGLQTCADPKTCPICAAPINERKANELRTMANQAEAMGLHLALMTFTAPHTAKDRLLDLIKGISAALSGFWRGEPAKRFKEKYGIKGHIRSFEVRYGDNGWHPHFHILIISEKKLPSTIRNSYGHPVLAEHQDDSWQWVLGRWQTMTKDAGLNCPNEYGLDIQNGEKAGEYICKYGSDEEILKTAKGENVTWDCMDEMTKGHVKLGRKGSLSPWDLLALFADADKEEDKKKAKQLFLDYARAMKGVTVLKWSRGLRAFFGLGSEKSDEQIIAEQVDNCSFLSRIEVSEWRGIIRMGYRSLILDLSENGGPEAMARLIFYSVLKGFGDWESYLSAFLGRGDDNVLDYEDEKTNKPIYVEEVKHDHEINDSDVTVKRLAYSVDSPSKRKKSIRETLF